MTRMMLSASALCLAVPVSLAATPPSNVPSTSRIRQAHPPLPRVLLPVTRADAHALSAMRFAVRGRTATWSFDFTCNGAHCKFLNTHHRRDREDPGYVAIDTSFDEAGGERDDDAASSARRRAGHGARSQGALR